LQNYVTDVSTDPDGHQHGRYKIGEKASPHILDKKNCCDLNLGESLFTVTFFLF